MKMSRTRAVIAQMISKAKHALVRAGASQLYIVNAAAAPTSAPTSSLGQCDDDTLVHGSPKSNNISLEGGNER